MKETITLDAPDGHCRHWQQCEEAYCCIVCERPYASTVDLLPTNRPCRAMFCDWEKKGEGVFVCKRCKKPHLALTRETIPRRACVLAGRSVPELPKAVRPNPNGPGTILKELFALVGQKQMGYG